MKVAYKAWQITEAVWILQRRGLVPLCYVLWFKMPQKQHEYWVMRTVSFLPSTVIIPKSPVAQSSLKDLPCSASCRLGGESSAPSGFPLECSVLSGCACSPHRRQPSPVLEIQACREKCPTAALSVSKIFFFYPLNYSWNQMPCFRNKQKPTQFPTNRLWNRISLLAFIADFWSLWVTLCQPYLLYCLKQNQIGAAMRKLLLH